MTLKPQIQSFHESFHLKESSVIITAPRNVKEKIAGDTPDGKFNISHRATSIVSRLISFKVPLFHTKTTDNCHRLKKNKYIMLRY